LILKYLFSMKGIIFLIFSVKSYTPFFDGIECENSDWEPEAEPHPVLETVTGKVRGRHRCKVNRRFGISTQLRKNFFMPNNFYRKKNRFFVKICAKNPFFVRKLTFLRQRIFKIIFKIGAK